MSSNRTCCSPAWARRHSMSRPLQVAVWRVDFFLRELGGCHVSSEACDEEREAGEGYCLWAGVGRVELKVVEGKDGAMPFSISFSVPCESFRRLKDGRVVNVRVASSRIRISSVDFSRSAFSDPIDPSLLTTFSLPVEPSSPSPKFPRGAPQLPPSRLLFPSPSLLSLLSVSPLAPPPPSLLVLVLVLILPPLMPHPFPLPQPSPHISVTPTVSFAPFPPYAKTNKP